MWHFHLADESIRVLLTVFCTNDRQFRESGPSSIRCFHFRKYSQPLVMNLHFSVLKQKRLKTYCSLLYLLVSVSLSSFCSGDSSFNWLSPWRLLKNFAKERGGCRSRKASGGGWSGGCLIEGSSYHHRKPRAHFMGDFWSMDSGQQLLPKAGRQWVEDWCRQ